MSDQFCNCYNKISIICSKCGKQYKQPETLTEHIEDLKKKIQDCNISRTTYKMELREALEALKEEENKQRL